MTSSSRMQVQITSNQYEILKRAGFHFGKLRISLGHAGKKCYNFVISLFLLQELVHILSSRSEDDVISVLEISA
jgi:hypothetical protein